MLLMKYQSDNYYIIKIQILTVEKFLENFKDLLENQLIEICDGSNDGICHDYKYCIKNYSLQRIVNYISPDTQFVIKLEKGKNSAIPSGCDYSLWADITLKCGGSLSPTSEPTYNPTYY